MKIMFLLFLQIVLLFSLGHSGTEVIDVTTIYDTERPNEVECHARTNAVGLSFITPDGGLIDPDDITNIPSCHLELDGPCPWEYMQWSQDEPKNHPTLPLLDPKYKKIWFLQESAGWLSSPPFRSTKAASCLSFIYHMDSDCDCTLEVYAKVGGDVQQLLDVVHSGNYSKWQVRRVTLEMDEPSSVIFAIQGYKDKSSASVAVFAMMGCHSQGMDETALMTIPSNLTDDFICQVANNIYQHSEITEKNKECKKKCNNGGFCDPATGSCICPPGFIGSECELGCGENHFGLDCEGHCSGDLFGCRGRKLCSPYMPCMCAPGYHGTQCKDRCGPGNYGGDCLQMCGHCDSNTTCDVFSGLCPDGCSQGYYPPSCKQHYSFLLLPPDVTEVDYENATITFSMREENLGGTGHPQYYRVDYTVDGEWRSEPPKLLPADSHSVHYLLSPLTAGKAYQVRVVLIDRDGSYYTINSENLIANFTTPCQVPSNPFYLIKPLWVKKHSFEVEWKYDPKVSGACPVENFAVYVEGELYIITNKTSVVVTDRMPYSTYNVWIQPLTVHGGLPISRPTRVVTPQGAPSEVVALTLTKGSPTALFLEWRPPNFKNGRIIHYLIKYQCLHYLACSESCSESQGNITSVTNNFVLTGLYPHSQYKVSVAAETIEVGPYTSILASTSPTEPEIAPEPSPVAVHNITSSSLTFNWTSVTNCKKLNGYPAGYLVSLYRTAESGNNILVSTNNVQRPPVQFQSLLPKQDYELHVRQLVSDNMFSKEYKLVIRGRTFSKHPPTVTNLQVTFLSAHFIDIQWEFPVQEFPAVKFIMSIECMEMLACPPPRDAYCTSPIDSFTNETSIRIVGLPPYAKYSIHISTFHKQHAASGAKLNVTTPMNAADTTPTMHPEPVKARGSTWAEIQWSPPDDCSLVHGELAAYGQRLLFQGTVLRETLTDAKTLSANFTKLMPSTMYSVEVFLVTGLENTTEHMFSDKTLQIMFMTLPRAPGPVTELVSFIHGFNSIALRFRLPDYPFGTIDSVTVRYQNLNISGKTGVKKMKLKKCQLWPNLICLQLEDLISRSQYKVTVSVWSSETKVEGEPSTITVITDKEVSGAPTALQFVNRTDSTLTLKWNVPVDLQGKLTAFSIDYIQTASVNSSWCCTNRTTLRVPVHKGEAYTKQITGLRPASSYNIEVRAVTKMSGPPVSMVEDTLPSKPSFKALPIPLPDTISDTSVEVWLPLPIPRPYSFISALFIVVHSRFDEPESSEQKSDVANELATLIGPKAYIAMELEELDLIRSSRVVVGGGEEHFGRHGMFKNKKLLPNHYYRVELVVLSAYKKLRVYGRTMSKPFETKKSFGNFTIPPETDEI